MERDFFRRLERARRAVRKWSKDSPPVGVITGSGLGDVCEGDAGVPLPYSKIPAFPRTSVRGHPGLLVINERVAVMKGRFHLYENLSTDDVILPVFLLHAIGVRTLILTNAAGGINPDYRIGELVLIRDHLNLTGKNPLAGSHGTEYGPRFPDMSDCYTRALREGIKKRFPALREGVYAGMLGPSYETQAEISMLRMMGADMVGMSTVPEAITAVFLGMKVAGVSCVTNLAGTRVSTGLSHNEVIAVGSHAAHDLRPILSALVDLAAGM